MCHTHALRWAKTYLFYLLLQVSDPILAAVVTHKEGYGIVRELSRGRLGAGLLPRLRDQILLYTCSGRRLATDA